jgi:NAD-dependent DNA ligase
MAAKHAHASGGGGSKSSSATAHAIKDRKSKAKDSKRMKQIFLGKVFSFSGDFGQNWSHEQMAGWVKAHGGRYEREVSNDTTHLICTTEHYKEKKEQG